jgi:protein TonB
MSPRGDIAWSRQLAGISASALMLWLFAGTVVLAAHAAAGWWVMRERPQPMDAAAEPSAIMIDLAAVPMAPAAVEEQIAPDEVDSAAVEAVEAEPVEEVDLAEAVEPVTRPVEAIEPETVEEIEPEPAEEVAETPPEEVEPVETVEAVEPDEAEPIEPIEEMVAALDPVEVPLPVVRPEPEKQEVKQDKPKEKPRKKQEVKAKPKPATPSVEKRKAQVRTQNEAPRAAAQQNSSGATPSVSPARWQSRVHSHIARRQKRDIVRKAGDTGTSQVRFSIDGSGNVLSASLARSSGNSILDDEAVSMVRRSSPVPAPPPGVNRTIILPIRFNAR